MERSQEKFKIIINYVIIRRRITIIMTIMTVMMITMNNMIT